jgi:hypothetical protein
MRHLYLALALTALSVTAKSQDMPASATIVATEAKKDIELNLDSGSAFWKSAQPVFITADTMGKSAPYRTEVRARWTKENLYLLYVAPFDTLNLKPDPDPVNETNRLWNWDVVEAFIGSDYQNIRQYKELEVSPQAEWVDLNIDLDKKGNPDAIKWNSGFKVAAHIDQEKTVWYAAMKIPFSALANTPAAAGQRLRIGLFRCAGTEPNRLILSWQPTMSKTFHSPEHFGSLLLTASKK